MIAATGGLVVAAITTYRLNFGTEEQLHRGLAHLFELSGFAFTPEVVLAPGDRVDFMLDSVAVEAKIEGSASSILRQLQRYAASPRVSELVLVTSKLQHARQFPPTVGGKPLHLAVLGASSL